MPRIGPFGLWELLIILFVLLLFFGANRLPGMARGIAESVGEFRKGIRDGKDESDETVSEARAETAATEGRAETTAVETKVAAEPVSTTADAGESEARDEERRPA